MSARRSTWGVLAVLTAATGCAPRTVALAASDSPSTSAHSTVPNWSDWGLTLGTVVVGDRVDYGRLLRDHEALDRFLGSVSQTGPECTPQHFPDRPARVAYYLNCHNAAVLRSIVELSRGDTPPAVVPTGWDRQCRFNIDGQARSPSQLRLLAGRAAEGDWRLGLALYDPHAIGPPIVPRPFLADILDAQLNEATRSALRSPRIVRVDHGLNKSLLVWQGLYEIQNDLIREYESRLKTDHAAFLDVLLEWADRPDRELLNGAIGYQVAELPADDRLNDLEPAPLPTRGLANVLHSIQAINFLRP